MLVEIIFKCKTLQITERRGFVQPVDGSDTNAQECWL